MKLKIFATFILITAAVVLLGRSRLSQKQNQPTAENQTAMKNQAIDYTAHTLRSLQSANNQKALKEGQVPIAGITSHHLPTAESFIDDFYRQLQTARPNTETFLIVGPDHFERCKFLASTTKKNFLSSFGLLENSREFTNSLISFGINEDDECFPQEHAIGMQTTFIKKYFPNAKAGALLFSSAAPADLGKKLSGEIFKLNPNVFVVCSTDFSHYESVINANKVDSKTEEQINNLDASQARLQQVDSPASLNFTVNFARLHGAQAAYLTHANSFDFTGNPDNTTSYFNVIFAK